MAEETDLSRTEPASPRRLQDARSAGDVPRSGELTAWVTLLAALGVLGWLAPRLVSALRGLTEAAFVHAAQPLAPAFLDSLQALLWAVLPVLAAIFVAALVAPLLLSGWVFAPQRAQADLSRASPLKAFARLLAAESWFDLLSGLLKLLIAAAAVWWALAGSWGALQPVADARSEVAPDVALAWVGRGLTALAAGLALVAALDAGWRWWRYLRRHAMTWQEVQAEARESEVSPEIRAQLRARQQQAGQGRHVDEVIG
jgi:flagellar biosynthetic protein FlhB